MMTPDQFEYTVTDPLEDTTPDPAPRRRMDPSLRRLLEAVTLVFVAPAYLVLHWLDTQAQTAKTWQPAEDVVVVARGHTGTIGHAQWRLLGRDATVRLRTSLTPPGGATMGFVLQVRALNATGAKSARGIRFQVRDRDGHVWKMWPDFPDFKELKVGVPTQVVVSGTIPERKISSVVLEARQDPASRPSTKPLQVLRFAR